MTLISKICLREGKRGKEEEGKEGGRETGCWKFIGVLEKLGGERNEKGVRKRLKYKSFWHKRRNIWLEIRKSKFTSYLTVTLTSSSFWTCTSSCGY